MSKYHKTKFGFTVALIVVAFLIPGVSKAVGVNFNITPLSIPVDQLSTMTYTIKLISTELEVTNECGGSLGGSNLYWQIQRHNMVSEVPGKAVAKSGSIRASDFLAIGSKDINGTFTEEPALLGKVTSINYQLVVGCGHSLGGVNTITKRLTASEPITVSVTGQKPGVVQVVFGANPRNVQPGSSNNFDFTLGITAKQSDIENKCRDDQVVWRAYMFPADVGDNFSNPIKSGAVSSTEFGNGKTVSQNFSQQVTALDRNFIFKARLTCDVTVGSDILTTSDAVTITSGGAGGGTCNNNSKCDSGETSATCKDCPFEPGETQIYPFEILNPLKGGADDFSELVKIIAQWIFNLAIPIAVAMIVYAGILFLTAAGEPSKVTKAKDVLKYAVIGLAIILIGSGFVTLIQSVLELGGTGQQGQPGPGGPPVPVPGNGEVGNKCNVDRDCSSGLKCKNTICQRPTGNWVGEPCNGGASCDVGLACDPTGDNKQIIDGQILGTCFETSATGGRIGNTCQKDSDCINGLKCNQICQRKGGNLNNEACFKTSDPSNCKSKACSTIGTAIEGVCVDPSATNPSNLVITANENFPAKVGQSYTMNLSVSGSSASILSWSVVSGSMPPGLNLSVFGANNSNKISGIPITVGTYTVVIRVQDENTGQVGAKSITITVKNP